MQNRYNYWKLRKGTLYLNLLFKLLKKKCIQSIILAVSVNDLNIGYEK